MKLIVMKLEHKAGLENMNKDSMKKKLNFVYIDKIRIKIHV